MNGCETGRKERKMVKVDARELCEHEAGKVNENWEWEIEGISVENERVRKIRQGGKEAWESDEVRGKRSSREGGKKRRVREWGNKVKQREREGRERRGEGSRSAENWRLQNAKQTKLTASLSHLLTYLRVFPISILSQEGNHQSAEETTKTCQPIPPPTQSCITIRLIHRYIRFLSLETPLLLSLDYNSSNIDRYTVKTIQPKRNVMRFK